jgi:hypothetical protein
VVNAIYWLRPERPNGDTNTAYPFTSCGRDVRAGRRLGLNLLRLRNLAYFLNRYCRRSSGIRVRRRRARLLTRASRTVGR